MMQREGRFTPRRCRLSDIPETRGDTIFRMTVLHFVVSFIKKKKEYKTTTTRAIVKLLASLVCGLEIAAAVNGVPVNTAAPRTRL